MRKKVWAPLLAKLEAQKQEIARLADELEAMTKERDRALKRLAAALEKKGKS